MKILGSGPMASVSGQYTMSDLTNLTRAELIHVWGGKERVGERRRGEGSFASCRGDGCLAVSVLTITQWSSKVQLLEVGQSVWPTQAVMMQEK